MTLLVTGGCGFIGSNLIKYLLKNREGLRIVNIDALTYAGNRSSLTNVELDPRYTFIKLDISDIDGMENVFQEHVPNAVINCAAESHVDRSLEGSIDFAKTNVLGVQVILELGRKYGSRILQVSTDEVYGSLELDTNKFHEYMPLEPTSPYAASKASADLLALASFRSYNQDVLITRSSNNFGPYQHPEKLIPLMITNAIDNKFLPIYGEGKNVRDWLHVEDHCKGLVAALERGTSGSIYNISGDNERTNISVVKLILSILGRPESLVRHVSDRAGHDLRYGSDFSRAKKELGWAPNKDFDGALRETVTWYVENEDWWRECRNGMFEDYYERQYLTPLRSSN